MAETYKVSRLESGDVEIAETITKVLSVKECEAQVKSCGESLKKLDEDYANNKAQWAALLEKYQEMLAAAERTK